MSYLKGLPGYFSGCWPVMAAEVTATLFLLNNAGANLLQNIRLFW